MTCTLCGNSEHTAPECNWRNVAIARVRRRNELARVLIDTVEKAEGLKRAIRELSNGAIADASGVSRNSFWYLMYGTKPKD